MKNAETHPSPLHDVITEQLQAVKILVHYKIILPLLFYL